MAGISASSNAYGTSLTLRMTGLTTSAVGSVTFTVTFGGSSWTATASKTSGSASSGTATVSGLTPGTTYSISAVCRYSPSGQTASASTTATTNDPTPSKPRYTAMATGTTITLTVSSVESNVSMYRFFCRPADSGTDQHIDMDASSPSAQFTGLSPDTEYVVNVLAYRYGQWSDSANSRAVKTTLIGCALMLIWDHGAWQNLTPLIYSTIRQAWEEAPAQIAEGGSF